MTHVRRPQPKQSVQSLLTYRPSFGETEQADLIRLSANEGALGPSPKVLSFLDSAGFQPHRYPEIQSNELNQAIAARYHLDADRIITSNGSDELIALLTMGYLEQGDEVVHSQYAFLVIPQAVHIAGGVPVAAADDGMTVSVDNMLAAVTPRTKMVFLVNPNNPTGTVISMDEVRRLHAGLPENVMLVLDWAYAEYLEDAFSDEAAHMVEQFDNVVMTRTFSKLHGLAAFRLGWAYCPEHILTTIGSIRGPFSVNSAAQQAGIIAVKDTEFQTLSIAHNAKWIAEMTDFLRQLGLEIIPSVTNFVLIGFDNMAHLTADEAAKRLAKEGILLRTMNPYGLGNYLRMSMGTDAEMQKVKASFASLCLETE